MDLLGFFESVDPLERVSKLDSTAVSMIQFLSRFKSEMWRFSLKAEVESRGNAAGARLHHSRDIKPTNQKQSRSSLQGQSQTHRQLKY
jgi:hypothetical protein